MVWQFHPFAILLLMSAAPLAVISFIAWRRRAVLTIRLFFWFTAFALGLVVSYAMELLSTTLPMIMFWLRWEYLFQWSIMFWFMFIMAYTGMGAWLTRRFVISILIIPTIILTLVWANGSQGLIWATTGVQIVDGLAMFNRTYGPGFWVWVAYDYLLLATATVILLINLIRWPQLYRGQALLLIIGMVFPWIANVLTLLHLTIFPLLDLVPFGIALTSIPIAFSLFRFRLLDLVPAAYNTIIESMSDPVIVADDLGRIVEVNPPAQTLFSLNRQKLVGKPVRDLLTSISELRKGFPIAEEIRLEWVYAAHENSPIFDLRISPLHDRLGHLTGQVFVLRDMSDRKQTEQQALDLALEREKVTMLEDFIRAASHDFRTPITTLKTSSYLMTKFVEQARSLMAVPANGHSSPESSSSEFDTLMNRMEEKIQSTEASANRLSQLVESMLEMTRLEIEQSFSFAPADLNALVTHCIETYQPLAKSHRLSLRLETDPSLPPVKLDKDQLERALQKLLDNAFNYTPAGGTVTIITRRGRQEAIIEIRDTGIGMSAEELPQIFERFYRADPARSMTTGGAGLGLPIVKRIIEAHEGRIEVESTADQGSLFRIHLPF